MTLLIEGGIITVEPADGSLITVSPCYCLDDDLQAKLFLREPVTIDPTSVGPNGLDSGVLTQDTAYSVYLIDGQRAKPAALLSANASNPILPPLYTRKRLLGSLLTHRSSAAVIAGQGTRRGSTYEFLGNWGILDFVDQLLVIQTAFAAATVVPVPRALHVRTRKIYLNVSSASNPPVPDKAMYVTRSFDDPTVAPPSTTRSFVGNTTLWSPPEWIPVRQPTPAFQVRTFDALNKMNVIFYGWRDDLDVQIIPEDFNG